MTCFSALALHTATPGPLLGGDGAVWSRRYIKAGDQKVNGRGHHAFMPRACCALRQQRSYPRLPQVLSAFHVPSAPFSHA